MKENRQATKKRRWCRVCEHSVREVDPILSGAFDVQGNPLGTNSRSEKNQIPEFSKSSALVTRLLLHAWGLSIGTIA